MVKMKLNEVDKYLKGLVSLGELKLPSKLSYAVNYNIEKLSQELNRAEKERIRLCEEYAKKDASGNPAMIDIEENGRMTQKYDITDADMRKLNEDLAEFLDLDVEIDIRKVKMDTIEKYELEGRYDVLSVGHMRALYFMLEE